MAPSGPDTAPTVSRLLRHPWAKLAVALLCLCALLLADVLSGPSIRIGGLMVAVPALAAGFLGPRAVALVSGVTLPFVVLAALSNNALDTTQFPVTFSAVVIISVASVVAAAAREKRERELTQARWVATTTQRLLLPPLPHRLGPLSLASLYLAADEEAFIGGDVYATASLPGRSRILVGDVQGKGLAAVEMVGYLLNAFRRAARACTELAALPDYLDRSLREDLSGSTHEAADADADDASEARTARRRALEGFVTAVVVDFDDDGTDLVRITNRGHPSPLLVHGDRVRALDPARPGVPIGLGDLDGEAAHVDTYRFTPGDTLLLYTDGVTEARDREGTFYPLQDRLARWTGRGPQGMLDALRSDLMRHVSSRLGDDVAMVAVHRPA